jgi:imidazolonepropionase-like amidohydrolase
MLVSLEPLGPSGGHSDPRNGIDPDWTDSRWGGSVVDGPVEAMKEVREHKRRGADVIKIMPSGGVLSIGDDPKAQLMTNEEIKAVIDTAHSLGMKVAAHAHGKAAIDNAVKLGVDSIEHGTYADAESYKLFIRAWDLSCADAAGRGPGERDGSAASGAAESVERAEGAGGDSADEGDVCRGVQGGREDRVRHGHLGWRECA